MTAQRTQIQIPERRDNEPPATAKQLQLIRQLVTGLSLQGYRFDYRKLGVQQAATITDQLLALRDAGHIPSTAPARRGPGCLPRLVKTIVVLAILAAIGAGLSFYLPQGTLEDLKKFATPAAPSQAPSQPSNTPATPPIEHDQADPAESNIFAGLSVSDDPGTPPGRPTQAPKDSPAADTPEPIAPPTLGPTAAKQLRDLEELLIKLSHYTGTDFALDVRQESSQAMQRKLADFPQAFAALDATDPGLTPRIRRVIAAFAADPLDGHALRSEVKALRQAFKTLSP